MHVIAFEASFLACLVYALRYGGKPERAAVTALLLANISTVLAIELIPHAVDFSNFAKGLAAIDFCLMLALTWIALTSNRLWTIVLAGFQLSLVLIHASKALYPALPAASYGIFAQFWAWPMIAVVAIGTRNHRKRVVKFGKEPDWKPLCPRFTPVDLLM